MDRRTWNILQLGLGFMFLFAGFNSQSFIEQVVLDSIASQTGNIDNYAGYYSLSIIYGFFTFGNFAAPPIVSAIGPKWAMTAGALTYTLFLVNFLLLETWSLYITSALVGLGSAVLWTGQGNFLALNSDEKTAGRNSGIVWALYQTSLIEGAVFLFVVFKVTMTTETETAHIPESTIRIIYASFAALSVVGALTIALLQSPQKINTHDEMGFLATLVSIFKLMSTKNMLILSVMFMYSGIEFTFLTGIYSTCLSFTKKLNIGHEILAYNALSLGIGQIVGGATFGVFGSKTNRYGRDPIVFLGCATQLISFFLIFINLPTDAPMYSSFNTSLIQPSIVLTLLCAFLLGLGDSCWNTQIYSILVTMYKESSAQAFAISKFYQALLACAAFYYGSHMQLRYQLTILTVGAISAAFCFFIVEREAKQKRVQSLKI